MWPLKISDSTGTGRLDYDSTPGVSPVYAGTSTVYNFFSVGWPATDVSGLVLNRTLKGMRNL
jgi:hypothetical protein